MALPSHALGQGAWHLGQGRHPPAVEEEAVRSGISLGMTLLDTSGNYGNGRSEQFLSHVISTEARPDIPGLQQVEANRSLWRRHRALLRGEPLHSTIGTPAIILDLYLLQLAGRHPPILRHGRGIRKIYDAAGKIRAWGVSNFDKSQIGKTCSVFRTAIVARPIRCPTASTIDASSVTLLPCSAGSRRQQRAVDGRTRHSAATIILS